MTSLRVVTWNVRHCRGLDHRVVIERVVSFLAPIEADVVALQEIDLFQPRSGAIDQAGHIAAALGMEAFFCRTLTCGAAAYGHALLSRLPVSSWESVPLPTDALSEPRALIDATLDVGDRTLRLCAVHLSLLRRERRQQAAAIAERLRGATVLLAGDLNAGPGQPGYAELVPRLVDPFASRARWRRHTWPAPFPLFALDHILVSPELEVLRATICRERFVSDHRPVLADIVVRAPPRSSFDFADEKPRHHPRSS